MGGVTAFLPWKMPARWRRPWHPVVCSPAIRPARLDVFLIYYHSYCHSTITDSERTLFSNSGPGMRRGDSADIQPKVFPENAEER
jgi:hypothetical protein